jgi:hypothetical protein
MSRGGERISVRALRREAIRAGDNASTAARVSLGSSAYSSSKYAGSRFGEQRVQGDA